MFCKRFTGHDFLQVVFISDEAICNILGYRKYKILELTLRPENFKSVAMATVTA